jgi:hypothetical protein
MNLKNRNISEKVRDFIDIDVVQSTYSIVQTKDTHSKIEISKIEIEFKFRNQI